MRILQTYKVYRPDVDGGVAEVMSQINHLREHGDEVQILVARPRGLRKQYVWDQTPVTAVSSLGQLMSMPIAPGFPPAFRAMAKHSDVIALHAPFPLNDIALALGVPDSAAVVVHWHAEIIGRDPILSALRPLIDRTLQRADRIIVSDQSIAAASSFLQNHLAKCEVVPYGTNVGYWSSLSPDETKAAEDIKRRYPRLITTIGRLVPYKGHAILLKAMTTIDATLAIVGEGEEYDRLLALAKELGITDRIIFKGFLPRNEIKTFLHASRVFAFPSISPAEAFGIAQIEAMASGLPVVNTDLKTAVPHVARDGQEGLTVKIGDDRALSDAINALLNDDSLAARLSAGARQRAQVHFSNTVFTARIRDIYVKAQSGRVGKRIRVTNRP